MLGIYRGKSFVSWRIKLATLSQHSHISWLKTTAALRAAIRIAPQNEEIKKAIIRAGCIEAWHIGGVRENNDLSIGHKKGTVIDLYDIPGLDEFKYSLIDSSMRNEIGKPYWFGGILAARTNRYLLKQPPTDKHGHIRKWFCSHLIEEKLREFDWPTVDTRRPSHGVWPGMIADSVNTEYLTSVVI